MSDIEQDKAVLKKLTREAHEAVQDLKSVIREGRELLKEIDTAAEVAVRTRLEPVVRVHIEELGKATEAAIDAATEAVDRRFDTIVDIMLGEDKRSVRVGRLSIVQMIENGKAIKRGEVPPHDLDKP